MERDCIVCENTFTTTEDDDICEECKTAFRMAENMSGGKSEISKDNNVQASGLGTQGIDGRSQDPGGQ